MDDTKPINKRNVLELLCTCDPHHLILDEGEAASLTGLSKRGMEYFRQTGRAPRHLRIGDRIKYRASDVISWLDQKAV